MITKFVIPGNPLTRVRHKHDFNDKIWDDYKRESFTIRRFIEDAMEDKNILLGPLFLEFFFFVGRPRTSTSPYPINKPPLHKMIHMYLACLEGLVFNGYQQIFSLKASKIYDGTPRAEIIIVKMEGNLE